MATITCADCRTIREHAPRNTNYCHGCRMLRNAEYYQDWVKTCEECGAKFTPIEAKDRYCGRCDLGYTHLRGDCKLCQKTNAYLVRSGVPVCKECARDSKQRRRLILGLRKGQEARIKQNSNTEAQPEPQTI